MDPKSLTKIKRFRKYYPDHELRVIDKKWFTKNGKKLSSLIPTWEKSQDKNSIYDMVALKYSMYGPRWK